MKKTILLMSSVAAAALLFSSYASGPALSGQNNKTGSNGGQTCATTPGCHSPAGVSATTGQFVDIINTTTNLPATTYTPGETYKITFTGDHPTLTKWGFQVFAGNSANTGLGTMAATMTNTHAAFNNNIVEHGTRLDQTNGQFEGEFEWTAPATGSGPVTFYGIINAVDQSFSVSGDAVSPTFNSITLTEATTGISEVAAPVATAYPNPTKADFTLKFTSKASSEVNVYDISGRHFYTTMAKNGELTIPSAAWPAGYYFVQVGSKNNVVPVVKQ